jgi:hypothetical protein
MMIEQYQRIISNSDNTQSQHEGHAQLQSSICTRFKPLRSTEAKVVSSMKNNRTKA